jgi:wyosine [tRNA(Phe)-imidazoG37] synthetase (radical SAM superfamily)
MSLVFGPIPSRRLGRSLGINNIPSKVCSYSCVYCQLGETDYVSLKRRAFSSPDEVYEETAKKINLLQRANKTINYITFVPDGEPTIDINLGNTIEKLKELGIKIAVITNSSLIWVKAVQEDLMKADWISIKIDSAVENIWRKINRPHGILRLKKIIQGLEEFACSFKGILTTETMLVKNVNDDTESIYKTADLIKLINPEKSYILVPTRPPAESWVKIPGEGQLNEAFQIFSNLNINTEILMHEGGTDFTFTSDAEKELLSILAVHPMRLDAVKMFLSNANAGWNIIDELIDNSILKEVKYSGNTFFIKNMEYLHS